MTPDWLHERPDCTPQTVEREERRSERERVYRTGEDVKVPHPFTCWCADCIASASDDVAGTEDDGGNG